MGIFDNTKVDEGDTTDKMFVLSLAEVTDPKYGFEANGYGTQDSHNLYQSYYPSSSRAATRTDFAKSNRATRFWWLRSPAQSQWNARCVEYYQDSNQNIIGAVYAGGMDMNDNTGAVRPAFNLDTSNVFMISAAEGSKNDDLGLASI